MGYIDADAHVIECEETWDYLDPSERNYRPVTVEVPSAVGGKEPVRMYLIGETLCRRFPTDCRGNVGGTGYSSEISHLENPAARLRDLDAVGIDAQVIFSTNFIAAEVANPLVEAAVARSWNRWMADRTADGQGRLRWAMIPGIGLLDRTVQEMEQWRDRGACAVMMKGVEHGMFLADPYFYPLYEKAQDLGMTIAVHQGAKRDHIEGLGIANPKTSPAGHVQYTATTAKGFYAVLASDLYKRFPRLNFAFVEAGATWAPFVFHHWMRSSSSGKAESYVLGPQGPTRNWISPGEPAEMMAERNMFISCDYDEDISYLVGLMGEGAMMLGTDWCHNDAGSDPLAHSRLLSRTDIPKAAAMKIVDDNGRKAFGIPADFRPTEKLKAKEKTLFLLGQY
jgi:predicted TIM-barrel fold metal-dependent hydrolase